jgi:hypothetical protein
MVRDGVKGRVEARPKRFHKFRRKRRHRGNRRYSSNYASSDGEIFLPTRPRNVLRFADGKFEKVLPFGIKQRSWSWRFLDFQSKDGEWWIPAAGGLRRYPRVADFAELARTPPKRIYTKADGLFSDEIFNLFEDSRGDVWITIIGGGENTLSRWERRTDKIFSYTNADGIPKSNGAISFAEDAQGSVWLGNYFGTLLRYRDDKFQLFTAKEGLPVKFCRRSGCAGGSFCCRLC